MTFDMNCLTKAASSHPSKKQLDRLTKVREYSTCMKTTKPVKHSALKALVLQGTTNAILPWSTGKKTTFHS